MKRGALRETALRPQQHRKTHKPRNRAGLNGAISIPGLRAATISAITVPITGPALMPKWELPKAKKAFANPGAGK